MRNAVLLSVVVVMAGCEGLSQGEHRPGGDTYLEYGAIGVDPETEVSFLMHVVRKVEEARDGTRTETVVSKRLVAGHPDWTASRDVIDLTGAGDSRILFPKGRVLVMAEREGKDVLTTLDRVTFRTLATRTVDGRYHGTRMSPSRRFVAVCEYESPGQPIHVIDAETLETAVVPHDGRWLELMWCNRTDRVVAIVFYGDRQKGEQTRARVLSWTIEDGALASLKPGDDGVWAAPDLDVTVPDVEMDMFFSYTWVGISPDDRYGVFPVRRPAQAGEAQEGAEAGWVYRLLVVDLATGEVRTVDHAQGPVGFSPDGSTIVSYRHDWVDVVDDNGNKTRDRRNARLVLIDRATLHETEVDLPFEAGPQFFVTSEGNVVVATSLNYDEGVVLHDLDSGDTKSVAAPGLTLDEFVVRPGKGEMWLVSAGLRRLDLVGQTVETVPVDAAPSHVNILPMRDLLVLDDSGAPRFVFLDPDTREVAASVPIAE